MVMDSLNTSSTTDIFYYPPLDLNLEDAFRLLDLLPGEDPAPIACALRYCRRAKAPPESYLALSYA